MKRTLLCVVLVLSLLLSVSCGAGSSSAAGAGTPDSGSASSGAASSGTSETPSSGAASSGTSETPSAGESTGSAALEFQMPDYSLGLQDNGFFANVTACDVVTLPKLEGVVLPKELREVSEDALQTEIGYFLEPFGTQEQIFDRAVQNGDTVNIDYIGMVDGVAFEGGSTGGMGTEVTIGVTSYIDDFLEQLIGVMPGETINVEVTFPDYYPNSPDLQGKDAVFKTVVNYICGDYVMPELTDEFVIQNLKEEYGYSSVADMKERLSRVLLQDQLRSYMTDWLHENCTFGEIPEQIIADRETQLRVELTNAAFYSNVTLEQMLAYYGWASLDEACKMYREDFISYAQDYLMCQAVAEKVGINVGEADLQEYFKTMMGKDEYASYASFYGMGYLCQDIMVDKVVNYLVEHSVTE